MDLSFLEKKGTIALLLFFANKQELRFRELKKVLPREATLSIRLHELESLNLVESVPIKDGRRKFFAYQLTGKGKEVTQKLKEI